MKIGILRDDAALSQYVEQICNVWGMCLWRFVEPQAVRGLDLVQTPVLLCPASSAVSALREDLVSFAGRGGTVILMAPPADVASAAGLTLIGVKEGPQRLRLVAEPAAGVEGELLPVVGRVHAYEAGQTVRVLAYLTHPGRYEGETVGITESPLGRGRVVVFAFDLPLCVLLLRQGDPARAERPPGPDPCPRPTSMAADIGPHDAGFIPFADLLSRLLVDSMRRAFPGPVPLVSHLPGEAPALVLFSGDEDGSAVEENVREFNAVREAGGRMSLYIIPDQTRSTPGDARRYAQHHDLGPHPNLRPLDGRPVPERVSGYEQQVRMFEDLYGLKARTVRQHNLAWIGYTDIVEAQERLGIRMDGSYLAGGTYMRSRETAPYATFGAAMPMRFCRPDGAVLDVYQQHLHLEDDVHFSDRIAYSSKWSLAQFRVILRRFLRDLCERFHMPYSVNFHPCNWARFAEPQGLEVLRQARELRVPIWSAEQWLSFLDARETWALDDVSWDGTRLAVRAAGRSWHEGLRLAVPRHHADRTLSKIKVDGQGVQTQPVVRYREPVSLVPLPDTRSAVTIEAHYEALPKG